MFIQQSFKNELPNLYLVGTPIGNLDDFSFRALEVLNQVDVILCEDTRTSLPLLNKYNIKKPLVSLHKFNELQRSNEIKTHLEKHHNLALISDAGVPVISDPGASLIHQLRWVDQLDFNVIAVNAGPAYIHALIMSGFLNIDNYFYGFIQSKNEASKIEELNQVFSKFSNTSLVFYESVHRIKATMKVLNQILTSNTLVTLNRELTKINEEVIYGTIEEVNQFVQSEAFIEKGEFVIVVDYQLNQQSLKYDDQQLIELIEKELATGVKLKQAVSQVSEQVHISKNYLYELYVKQK